MCHNEWIKNHVPLLLEKMYYQVIFSWSTKLLNISFGPKIPIVLRGEPSSLLSTWAFYFEQGLKKVWKFQRSKPSENDEVHPEIPEIPGIPPLSHPNIQQKIGGLKICVHKEIILGQCFFLNLEIGPFCRLSESSKMSSLNEQEPFGSPVQEKKLGQL